MTDNLKILENVFKREMKNKNFEEFKRTHPTLLSVILKAMDENYNSAINDVINHTKGFREYNYLQAELNRMIKNK